MTYTNLKQTLLAFSLLKAKESLKIYLKKLLCRIGKTEKEFGNLFCLWNILYKSNKIEEITKSWRRGSFYTVKLIFEMQN